ncbi:hypothetical protein VP01_4375g1 [Puccinia sorghi]|uniref:Uncharacterized protein n=1 Tax=Puccinia sorghi TaxID=27349 RepID=A0A0L6UQL0_9BASI|nr:hypothetical protein VP01_4375g1 [Puccinia sorghi]
MKPNFLHLLPCHDNVQLLSKSKFDPLIPQYQPISCTSIPCPTTFVPFFPHLILPWWCTVESAPKNKVTNILQSNCCLHSPYTVIVLALICLDLSPHSRNNHNNLFIAGIIPGPIELDMTTISHVLAPLINDFFLINTIIFMNNLKLPNGHRLSVQLGVLIRDIVASHKVAVGKKVECKLSDDTDILLNRLPYWYPVRNFKLGVMNNSGKRVSHSIGRCEFEPEPPKQLSHNDQLDDWEDNVSKNNEAISEFKDSASLHIRKSLPSTIVPCRVTCIPLDLGDPNGKLKASKQHVLFSTYLPLSLIDLSVKDPAYCGSRPSQNILLNVSSLFICTKLVSMKSILDADSNNLAEAYLLYAKTSEVIFHLPKVLPNHYYSLHLPEKLIWWGPLSNVSKFSGQRVTGIIKKMKTNGKLGRYFDNYFSNKDDSHNDHQVRLKACVNSVKLNGFTLKLPTCQ